MTTIICIIVYIFIGYITAGIDYRLEGESNFFFFHLIGWPFTLPAIIFSYLDNSGVVEFLLKPFKKRDH